MIKSEKPRVAPLERVVLASMLCGLIAFPLTAHFFAVALIFAALTFFALVSRFRFAFELGLFFTVGVAALHLGVGYSQLWIGASFLGYGLIASMTRGGVADFAWLRRGKVDRTTVVLAATFTLGAAIALILWQQMTKPDLHDLFTTFVPHWPLHWLLLGALGFSMFNAAAEEIAYRGLVLAAIESGFGAVPALLGQAIAFGTLHINGFPRGAIGVALASIYGVMMGFLRLRSRGLLVPWAAHVITDFVIAMILLLLAR